MQTANGTLQTTCATRIRKAILLAAGLGTRLKPLTLTTPKPLLPLDGHVLIDFGLSLLARTGVEEVAINLHHLGEKIRAYVGSGSRWGLTVRYSEEPTILGTGGGIAKAASFFDGDPFIALNADALIDADMDALIARHASSGAAATMVLKKLAAGDAYQPVEMDEHGFVVGIDKRGAHFYTGLQVITSAFLETLPPANKAFCLIEDGYKPFLKRGGRVAALIHEGYFNDVGTIERYEQARRDVASGIIALPQKPAAMP